MKVRDAGERVHDGGISPCPFIKEAAWPEVPSYESIIGNCMVCQDQTETFIAAIRAPSNLRMFFYNFWYYFWSQHRCWKGTSINGNDFFILHKFALPSTFYCFPCPTILPASLVKLMWSKQWNVFYVTEIILSNLLLLPAIYSTYILFLAKDGDTWWNMNIHKLSNL